MILLSFDIEEFDLPLEHKYDMPFEEQISISKKGTEKILQLLKKYNIKATFYVTANFAQNAVDTVEQIVLEGHELASHGFYHSDFDISHLKTSKEILEKIGKTKVEGYRMARMTPIDESEVKKAGYTYNSSINPTFLPGRYNNLKESRTYFYREEILQIPASVTPVLRIPLFWLTFHNIPLIIYKLFAKRTLKKDRYLNIYFHSWEFMPIDRMIFLPYIIKKNTGKDMEKRFEKFISWAIKKNCKFQTTKDFILENNL